MTIQQALLHHLGAEGPATFQSCWNYVREQCTAPIHNSIDNFQVADALNELIREGKAEIAENGTTFDSTHSKPFTGLLAHLDPLVAACVSDDLAAKGIRA